MTKLVIDDVDDLLMSDLSRLAVLNQVSVETLAKQMLRQSIPAHNRSMLADQADAIAAMTPKGVQQIDSVELLREDRQR